MRPFYLICDVTSCAPIQCRNSCLPRVISKDGQFPLWNRSPNQLQILPTWKRSRNRNHSHVIIFDHKAVIVWQRNWPITRNKGRQPLVHQCTYDSWSTVADPELLPDKLRTVHWLQKWEFPRVAPPPNRLGTLQKCEAFPCCGVKNDPRAHFQG